MTAAHDTWAMAQLVDALADRAVRLCWMAGDAPASIDLAWWRYMIVTVHGQVKRISFARIEAMDDEAALAACREIHRIFSHRPLPVANTGIAAHVQA